MQAQQFWTKAYQRNIGKMIGMNFRYVGDRALAEDLAHDAFLKAIEKSESYRHLGSFEGWLMRLNLNNTLDWLRRQPKFMSIEDLSVMVELQYPDVETQNFASPQDEDFTEEEILSAICALPEKQRTVFNLYVFEKQKHTKIAETLQIGVRSSKRYLAEARVRLQQLLKNKQQHKKSGIMILLSLISLRGHAIDRLCRTKLKHFAMAPSGSSPLTAFQWAIAPKPSAWLALSAGQGPAVAGIAGVGMAAAVASSVAVWQAKPTKTTTPLPKSDISEWVTATDSTDTLAVQRPEPEHPQNTDTSVVSAESASTPIAQSTSQPAEPTEPLSSESHHAVVKAPAPNHGLKIFRRNGYCGLQDEEGNIIVYPKYSSIGPFDVYRSGWAMVDLFGFKGFIDSNGREVVHPQYDEIGTFGYYMDGRAWVRKGNLYGLIDLTGQEVVPVTHKLKELIQH